MDSRFRGNDKNSMKTVIQRVKKASVKIENEVVGEINKGLLILLAVHQDDAEKDIEWMVKKVLQLRIFSDDNDPSFAKATEGKGKMNLSVQDIKGEILVVSQFTLYGDCKKGNRPSFEKSAEPVKAKEFYEKFVDALRDTDVNIQTGKFQEQMEIELINDGPVTIIIDSK